MQRMGVAGIALSTAFVHLLSAVALYIYIFRRIGQKIRDEASIPGLKPS